MSGPIGPTDPCPHGVVDDICEPCTLRNHLVALVELCDALEVVGHQVEDAREIVVHRAVQASPPVCPDNLDGHEYRDITEHQHHHRVDWCVHCGDIQYRDTTQYSPPDATGTIDIPQGGSDA